MQKFQAKVEIIGINPFVFVPEKVLFKIFKQAGREKGFIPIRGTVNDKPYKQTLVRYRGEWRFYINTIILKHSPKRIGEIINISIEFDPISRALDPPASFVKALKENKEAKNVFDALSASRKMEITRYLVKLKTKESLEKNINKSINFLTGKEKFVGRDKP